jgi:hypothetical protein
MQNLMTALFGGTTKVTIVGNENIDGKPLVTPLTKPDGTPKTDLQGNPLGSIRLEQHVRELNGTFMNARRKVAFVGGTIDELTRVVEANKLVDGSTIPGKIVTIESLAPMYKGQSHKVNPTTDEPIGVTVGEKFHPVYMQMKYTENENDKDSLIRDAEAVNAWYARNAFIQSEMMPVETAGIPSAN